MLFEMRRVDQFEDWDGVICNLKAWAAFAKAAFGRMIAARSESSPQGTQRNTGEGLSFACVPLVRGPLNRRGVILSDSASDFAMLTCATNPFQCVATGGVVSRAADRHFSAFESPLVVVDRGGAVDRRDLAGALSGDTATAT